MESVKQAAKQLMVRRWREQLVKAGFRIKG
jgi:hypothetical protein